MEEIPDEYIDIIITSPPYNRGKKYSSDDGSSYNDKMPENQYLEFLTNVWEECLKKSTEKCVFFLNIGDSANDQGISEKVALSAEKAGWKRGSRSMAGKESLVLFVRSPLKKYL